MTASGAMDSIEQAVRPLFAAAGIPEELISLIFLRPVSGSGSLVVAEKNNAGDRTRFICRKSSLRHGRKLRNGVLRTCPVFRVTCKNEARLHIRYSRICSRRSRICLHMYNHVISLGLWRSYISSISSL